MIIPFILGDQQTFSSTSCFLEGEIVSIISTSLATW